MRCQQISSSNEFSSALSRQQTDVYTDSQMCCYKPYRGLEGMYKTYICVTVSLLWDSDDVITHTRHRHGLIPDVLGAVSVGWLMFWGEELKNSNYVWERLKNGGEQWVLEAMLTQSKPKLVCHSASCWSTSSVGGDLQQEGSLRSRCDFRQLHSSPGQGDPRNVEHLFQTVRFWAQVR